MAGWLFTGWLQATGAWWFTAKRGGLSIEGPLKGEALAALEGARDLALEHERAARLVALEEMGAAQ